jgi:hypothetical protein
MAAHGARGLGVENMAKSCIQGRAVMIDLFAHYGRTRQWVGYDELMHVLEKDKVVVETGDLVCLRTGFDNLILEQGRQPSGELLAKSCAVLDGDHATRRRSMSWTDQHDERESGNRSE